MTIAGIVVTGLFYWATLVVFATLCAPRGTGTQSQMSYLQALASAKCERTRPLSVLVGAFNVVSDLYLILLPLPAVWSLNLPLPKKLGVLTIFLTGSMSVCSPFKLQNSSALTAHSACIASILGLVYRIDAIKSTDNTWVVIPAWTTT